MKAVIALSDHTVQEFTKIENVLITKEQVTFLAENMDGELRPVFVDMTGKYVIGISIS